jgi:serine/threonine protein kinase/tetratricopeptide (TPR) repeat protein
MSERDIFEAALELPPERRGAYLDSVCGCDAALRERLEALLSRHDRAGAFLEKPAAVMPATVDGLALSEQPGTMIGPYKLMEQIGEGGMGLVFVAEQTQPVHRKVALKVLKPGMDSRQVVARFEAERQALALMDHPHIARVLDGGTTPTGRPYFVMELVKGVPITEFCDQNQVSVRQRLELFLHVCEAVHHAHQKGIIHRDIKPSNVLVLSQDGTPVVKVIDFGIAKAIGQQLTDKTIYTQFAQMIGTPLYMSPEQAGHSGLDVDTRTDIYALGVLLYELLTGTTPFDKERLREAGYDEMRRIICEEEPPRPSTRISTLGQAASTVSAQRRSDPRRLSQLFRGELDWIVMKALEKDRNRRFESASAFAADVQRYLDDEPVLACPPSAAYRFHKFARRNRVALFTGALIAVALVTGTAVASWQAVLATRAQTRAQDELVERKKQQQRAEANFLTTLEAVDQLFTEVGQKELASVPHLEHVRRQLLQKALGFFQEFLRTRPDDPSVRFEVGLAYRRVGDIHRLLGEHGPGEKACNQAIQTLDALRSEEPQRPAYCHELARAHWSRGRLLVDQGRRQSAESDFRHARELLDHLRADDPDRPEYQEDLALTCQVLAELLNRTGPHGEAEQLLREGARRFEFLLERFPQRVEYTKGLMKCHGTLALILRNSGQEKECDKVFRRMFDLVGKALARFATDQDLRFMNFLCHLNYGNFLWRSGRTANAEELYRQAAGIGEQLVADFPNVPRFQNDLCGTYGNLGSLLLMNRRIAEAEQPLRQAVTVAEKLAAGFPTIPDYRSGAGGALSNLAMLLASLKRPGDARALLEKAIQHQEAAHALSPRNKTYREFLRNHATNLAFVLKDLGAPAADLDVAYDRSVSLSQALVKEYPEVAEYHRGLGDALYNWAGLLRERRQHDKAVGLLQESVVHHKAALKVLPRNPLYRESLRMAYHRLADLLDSLDRPEAEEAYHGLIAAARDVTALAPVTAGGLSNLAAAEKAFARWLNRHGKAEEARQLLNAAARHEKEATSARGTKKAR